MENKTLETQIFEIVMAGGNAATVTNDIMLAIKSWLDDMGIDPSEVLDDHVRSKPTDLDKFLLKVALADKAGIRRKLVVIRRYLQAVYHLTTDEALENSEKYGSHLDARPDVSQIKINKIENENNDSNFTQSE